MKISKKIFACVLTVCMLLTMFAGVLSASAAVAGSATIGSAKINVGEAAEVSVILNADAAIGGADLYIAFPEEAAVSAAVATAGYSLEYKVAGEMAAEGNADLVEGVAHFILLASDDAFTGATAVEIVLTVAGLAEGEYAVAFADGTIIGTTGEVAVAAELVDGAITVIAEVACDHAETKDVVTEAATCGKAGTKNIVCALCDEVIKEGVEIPATGEHTYANNACTVCGAPYGEPEVKDNIGIDLAMNISETINVRIIVTNAKDAYADFDLVISRQRAYRNSANSNYYDLTETQDFVYNLDNGMMSLSNGRASYLYNEVGMYELGIPITFQVKCYDANGNYVAKSNPVTKCVGELARAFYGNENTALKNKNLAIDIARLGDAAQTYMVNGKDCDLADIPSPLSYFPAEVAEGAEFDIANYTAKSSINSLVSGVSFNDAGLNVAGNPCLSFIATGLANYNRENLSFDIDYTNAKNGQDKGIVVPGANLDALSNGRYSYLYSAIALYDTNVQVTVTLKDGETELANITYSIEDFVAKKYGSNARLNPVLEAVACLGISARGYFGM